MCPFGESGRVEIKDGHRVGAVAAVRVVAGHTVHPGHAEVGKCHELPLKSHSIAIAAIHARPGAESLGLN